MNLMCGNNIEYIIPPHFPRRTAIECDRSVDQKKSRRRKNSIKHYHPHDLNVCAHEKYHLWSRQKECCRMYHLESRENDSLWMQWKLLVLNKMMRFSLFSQRVTRFPFPASMRVVLETQHRTTTAHKVQSNVRGASDESDNDDDDTVAWEDLSKRRG